MPNSDRGKPWYRIEAKAAGAISGSAIVKIIENNLNSPDQMLRELKTFVSSMKAATRG